MKRLVHGSMIIFLILYVSNYVLAQAPVTNFSAAVTTSCAPAVISFTDLSTGSPVSWRWDLGNGTIATNQNPTTVYTTPGTYTVVLTAANASGSNTKTQVNYITITPTPTVAFTSNDTAVACAPKTVQFINQTIPNSTSGPVTYSWDFGDGFTSTLANPSHTYNTSGNYNVTLVVTNGTGCTAILTKNTFIKVAAKAIPGFTAVNNNSCLAPATVSFTNTSVNGVSYQWFFGDGSTSPAVSPAHTYNTPGTYTVTLIAANAAGCRDTIVRTAMVNIGNLAAGFTTGAAAACAKTAISFTNTTVPASAVYAWDFGDGTTSTLASPVHNYASAGTYTIKLVSSVNGCSDSVTKSVVIYPAPVPQFTATNNLGCSLPLTVSFNNSSAGATGFLWLFGDGGTSSVSNPTHTYTTAGLYSVTLIATNSQGCRDTLVMTDFVKVAPLTGNIVATRLPGCAPAVLNPVINVSSAVPVTAYLWNFGDGTTATGAAPAHTYTAGGVYTLTVTVTTAAGCTLTLSTPITVGSHVTPSFTATPTSVCTGQPVNFTNTTSAPAGVTYTWLFGDGGSATSVNPVYPYNTPGVYTPVLISNSFGCMDTFRRPNYITVTPPKAEFSVLVSCANHHTVSFTDASIGATTWSWDFGDGSTYNGQHPPAHTYAANGTYTVTLTVSNGICTHVKTLPVDIFNITNDFTAAPTTVCSGTTPVNFTALADPHITSYTWYYGDGTSASTTVNTISHLYTTTGNYTVSLVVKDIYNCKDSISKINYVHVNGINPLFTANNVIACSAVTIVFTDQSTTNISTITGRTWNFGDSTTVSTTAPSVSHVYSTSGRYTVTLTVVDNIGCTNTLTRTQYITITKPVPGFSTTDTVICQNTPVSFVNTSTGAAPLTYSWDFGDGTASAAVSPVHLYTASGTYTVRLIATDVNGCKDTLTRVNYIHADGVKAGFTLSDTLGACPPLTVNFTNTSTGATSYFWDFGNGNTSASANPDNVFTLPGVYTVTLKVRNASGCMDSIKKTVRVKSGPSGTFSYAPVSGCFPLTVNFSTTNANTAFVTFDFNNGFTQTTSANTYSYTYTQPGNYLPVLVLSNGSGCNTSIVGVDTIKIARIYAGFKAVPDTVCLGTAINFTDTSKSISTSIATRTWNFGDGTTATGSAATHTYTTAGTYRVRLIANGPAGCPDTAFRTVTVRAIPLLTAANQIICSGGSANLSVTGATTYTWSPATGLSCTNCANPVATPATTTTYTVTGTTLGCSSSQTVTVSVNPLPSTLSAGGDKTICAGTGVTLNGSGAISYLWSPATGLSCTTCANPVATPTVTTTYSLTGTSAAGCTNTINVVVTVNARPIIRTADQQICTGGTASLNATGANSYVWSPATGLSCTVCSNPSAAPATTTTYVVTGTGINGCTDTAHAVVTVNPLPVITVSGTTVACVGTGTTLNAAGAATYVWSPAAGLSCTSCTSPVATPPSTTTYTVTGTNGLGCTGSTSVTVTVNLPPHISAGSNVSTCAGTPVTLNATGAATYVWSPATGLSCTSCAAPSANPAVTTTYTVTGTDVSGCTDTARVTVTIKPKPVITTAGQTICNGGSATLAASGGISYVWSPAAGLSCTTCASPVASPAATSVYTVTGTDAGGCSNTATATVTVNSLPVITVTGNTSNCAGTPALLTATGATTYVWSPATGLSCTSCANPAATPASTTTYTVTGTNAPGCTGSTSVTVTVHTPPSVSAGSNVSTCAGTPVTLNATGAATYVWSPATGLSCTSCAAPAANPAVTTTYTVTGTDAFGCTDTARVTVTIKPKPVITTAGQTICIGGSATLAASGGVSYVWSPATGLSCTTCASPAASPSSTTVYTVTGTDAGGCSNTATATVTVNPLPVITITGNTSNCAGTPALLTATGAAAYVWSPATGLSCTTCANPVATPATTTTYTVTATSAAGCVNTKTVTVTVRQPPVVSAGNHQSACSGTPVTLTAGGAATYVWSPAAGLSCTTCASPSATPVATTTYIVTGTDAFGCHDTSSVTVTVKPLPVITTTRDTTICKLTSVQLNVTGGVSYLWSPATGLSCATCDNPVASPAGDITYTVTGTGANGCINTGKVTVRQHQQPAVNAGPDQTICAGKSATLSASGASSYVWSPAVTLSCSTCYNPLATPASTSVYQVTGTDLYGCTDSDKVIVTVIQKEQVAIGTGGEICEGESFQLSASAGYNYTWYPAATLNNSTIYNPLATPAATTTYQVIVRQGQCFADTLSATVVVHPRPTVDAGPDRNVTAGTTATLTATGTNIKSYLWSPADELSCTTCPSPAAAPKKTTTYSVQVASEFGCQAKDEVTLFVTCDGKQVWLPNTFTPNNDGANDRFYPHGRGINTILRFRIYDRWGEVLYDRSNVPTDDASYGWDGTYKNQQLKPDVYVYIIVAECSNGERMELKGDISLIR